MYIVSDNSTNRAITHLEAAKLRRWRASTFWVCLIGYIGYYICRANLPAAFPMMSAVFGYTNAQLGMIAATSEGAYALGKFINGPIADKLGGKKIFLVGLAGAIFFNILFALSTTLFWFTAIWCLCRYFLSMGWGGLAKMIGNWYPPEKNGTVMGIISINFQFGGVVATLFAGYLVSIGVDWKGVFLYPALVGFIVLIWSALSSKNHPSDAVPGAEVAYHQDSKKPIFQQQGEVTSVRNIILGLLKLRIFQHLLVFSFVAHILRSFFFFWTPKLLVDIGMGTTNAIFKSALFPLFGCLGTILLGWYSDRYAKNGDRARAMWVMLIGLSVSLLFLSQTVYIGSSEHILIGVFLSLSGFFLLGPYSMSAGALTLDIAGARGAGTSAGLIDGVGYIGGAVATFIAGLISDRLGWQGVFYFLTACSLLATLSAYIMSLEFQKMHATRLKHGQENP